MWPFLLIMLMPEQADRSRQAVLYEVPTERQMAACVMVK
jgi:hypothetical protein